MEANNNLDSSIITAVSKEKFRRRLLISSRLLALFLIIVIVYLGVTMNGNATRVAANPCYYCGYTYGKLCTQQYEFIHMNSSQREDFFINLGKFNSNFSNSMINMVNTPGSMGLINISFNSTEIST